MLWWETVALLRPLAAGSEGKNQILLAVEAEHLDNGVWVSRTG